MNYLKKNDKKNSNAIYHIGIGKSSDRIPKLHYSESKNDETKIYITKRKEN